MIYFLLVYRIWMPNNPRLPSQENLPGYASSATSTGPMAPTTTPPIPNRSLPAMNMPARFFISLCFTMLVCASFHYFIMSLSSPMTLLSDHAKRWSEANIPLMAPVQRAVPSIATILPKNNAILLPNLSPSGVIKNTPKTFPTQ